MWGGAGRRFRHAPPGDFHATLSCLRDFQGSSQKRRRMAGHIENMLTVALTSVLAVVAIAIALVPVCVILWQDAHRTAAPLIVPQVWVGNQLDVTLELTSQSGSARTY